MSSKFYFTRKEVLISNLNKIYYKKNLCVSEFKSGPTILLRNPPKHPIGIPDPALAGRVNAGLDAVHLPVIGFEILFDGLVDDVVAGAVGGAGEGVYFGYALIADGDRFGCGALRQGRLRWL